jgi:hypothetical protein
MADSLQPKRTWVDPKLTVFGDVNGLTLKSPVTVGDGYFFTGFGHTHVPIAS